MRHPARRSRTTLLVLAASLAAALAAGCGQARTVEPHAQSVSVEVLPPAADVKPGATQAFSAAVTGTTDTGVTWTIQEASGGTVSASGLYTAPAATGTFHLVVTSTADATASATATVTVTTTPAVAITISPATASVTAGATRQFTATVTGSSTTTKTWSVVEAGGGTVSASGLYTAPATPGTYHVVATSVADATRTATATVTVTAPVVAVTVSPTTTSVAVGATAQLTASVTGSANTAVTWSVNGIVGGNSTIGTITTSGRYDAPRSVPSPATVTVRATSVADSSKSAAASVIVIR